MNGGNDAMLIHSVGLVERSTVLLHNAGDVWTFTSAVLKP